MKKNSFVENTQIMNDNFSADIDESLQIGLDLLNDYEDCDACGVSDDVGMTFEEAFNYLNKTTKTKKR